MSSARTNALPTPMRRIVAAACAALVFALTIFASSPVAHEWLHAVEKKHSCNEHPAATTPPASTTADHDCAVVLFASGVELPVGPVALTPPRVLAPGLSPITAAEFYLVSPRYLRQPERGPPSLG